jgi:hypothetical protein
MTDKNEILSLLDEAYGARVNNLKRSIELAEKALFLSRQMGDKALTGKSLSNLSLYFMIMGEYDRSRAMAEEAIGYFEELGDEQGIADAKYNIAGIYYKTDNYHLGLAYLMDCQVIYRKFGDYYNLSRVEKSLGTIYDYLGDQKNSVASYQNAIDAAEKVNDLNLKSNAYNNLSGVYLKQGKIADALELAEESIRIKKQTGDDRGLAFAIYARGKVLTQTGRYAAAEQDLLSAITIHREMGERLGLGMAFHKLGRLYAQMGELEKARKVLGEGLAFSEKYNIVITKFKCDHLLYHIYRQLGDHSSALVHLERYLQEKELVINTQTLKVIENYELMGKMKALEQEAKLQKAEEAMRVRQEFLSTMSHEIRTPLNAVITIISMLRDKSDAEEKQLLDALRFASNNLLRIINDILDFTKLDTGKAMLELHDVKFKPLLENIWHTYETMASEKGLKLALKLDVGLAESYELDETKLTQILGNLISNAIKFTEKGRIDIEIEKAGTDGVFDQLHFSIKDTGEGIHADDLNKIFESFSHIKPITTRKQGGTGLGLAIVKKLTELYGGTVDLKSTPGAGSTFSFTLRLKRGAGTIRQSASVPAQLQDKTALLAEDNDINAFVAIKLLSKWGITTVHAVNGFEAVEKARQKMFDFILMDIHMPEMNGFDAAAQIRSEENPNTRTPMFALTADITAAQQKEYAGFFNGFLWKPLQPDKLHEALARAAR